MMTVTILTSNSDDKLTQRKWSEFCGRIDNVVALYAASVHFSGLSEGSKPWQNACWVVMVMGDLEPLRVKLARLASEYGHSPIAFVYGETEFLKGE